MFYSLAGHFFTKIEFFFFSLFPILLVVDFPCGSAGKELACNAGDLGSIPGLGRFPGEGKDYPLQYSGLENPQRLRHNFHFQVSLSPL